MLVSVTAVSGRTSANRKLQIYQRDCIVETTFEPESLSVLDVVRHDGVFAAVAESMDQPRRRRRRQRVPGGVPEMVSVAHEHANSRSTVYALVDASKRSAAPTALPTHSARFYLKLPRVSTYRKSVSIANFHVPHASGRQLHELNRRLNVRRSSDVKRHRVMRRRFRFELDGVRERSTCSSRTSVALVALVGSSAYSPP